MPFIRPKFKGNGDFEQSGQDAESWGPYWDQMDAAFEELRKTQSAERFAELAAGYAEWVDDPNDSRVKQSQRDSRSGD